MEKVEKNKIELQKFIDSLKDKQVLETGDTQLYGHVVFSWNGESVEDTVRVILITEGHHAGKVQVVDENKTFKDVFVRFISNGQDYEFSDKGIFKISDTSGKSKLGNYEVTIEEK